MSNPALADVTAALSDLVVSEANSVQEQVPAIKEVQDTAEVCVLTRTDRRLISVQVGGPAGDNNSALNVTSEAIERAAATAYPESLQLLSVCAMLPSGLRPGVFAKLRPRFADIELACKTLRDFDLVSVGADGELKPTNSIHNDILARHHLNRDYTAPCV